MSQRPLWKLQITTWLLFTHKKKPPRTYHDTAKITALGKKEHKKNSPVIPFQRGKIPVRVPQPAGNKTSKQLSLKANPQGFDTNSTKYPKLRSHSEEYEQFCIHNRRVIRCFDQLEHARNNTQQPPSLTLRFICEKF
ncbi:hypothetical protein AVEN_215157-1 [Araneus ventricosus]|uniref:Uncharacterized protein n=1 Tax=Araneus ventricosus TaxID=182803 RepID=A0A4Y2RU20_ARAVE|nr:hypothetical protein AVEN_215157-1 [Araneus ventricosus]